MSVTGCWCCGALVAEDSLVRLGAHPEVAICAPCVKALRREAASGPLQRRMHTVRVKVIVHGWHRRRVVGPILRKVDSLLP